MSNIMIIGGHGKVALQLSQILSGDGHRVNSVIRSESQVQDVEDRGATAVVADVEKLDTDGLKELVAGQDAVVHLAAKVDVTGPWAEYERANVTGTRTVLTACAAAGVTFVEVDQQAFADAARDAVIGAVDADIRPLAEQIFNN